MKRFIEGEDRSQVTLLPDCLDDYIGEDNPVRVVDAFVDELDLENTFHAGIGKPENVKQPCHIILNPALLDATSIAPIIGDVFLEWLHCESRRDSSIRDFR